MIISMFSAAWWRMCVKHATLFKASSSTTHSLVYLIMCFRCLLLNNLIEPFISPLWSGMIFWNPTCLCNDSISKNCLIHFLKLLQKGFIIYKSLFTDMGVNCFLKACTLKAVLLVCFFLTAVTSRLFRPRPWPWPWADGTHPAICLCFTTWTVWKTPRRSKLHLPLH